MSPKTVIHVNCVHSVTFTCRKHLHDHIISLTEKVWIHNPAILYWNVCTKTGKLAVIYLCVSDIDFAIGFWNCSDNVVFFFSIRFWNCSDSVVFFCFSVRFCSCSDSVVFFVFLLDFRTVLTVWYFLFFF